MAEELKKLEEQAEQLVNLSVKEVKSLIDILKDKYGIEPAAAAATVVAAAPAEEGEGGGEKSNYNVVLKEVGASKLQVVKALKSIFADLDLKACKELVDKAPNEIKKDAPKAEAEEIQKILKEAGATVELT